MSDKDIEIALRLLNHPEEMEEEKNRKWLAVPENDSLYRKMRNMREAGLWELSSYPVDVEAEWRNFEHHRMKGKSGWMRKWPVAAAAVLVLGFALWGLLLLQQEKAEQPLLAQVEYKLEKGVTLIAEEDAVSIPLHEPGDELTVPGVKIFRQDSLHGILYTPGSAKVVEKKYHTLRVPRAADYMIVLEDSTRVWVNAESELRYPLHFGQNERVVELKGEAYFEVRHDPGRPFKVKTEFAETRVLGTEFNFQAYSKEQLNVTLVKGRIGVKTEKSGELILKPGENVSLSPEGMKIEEVDVLKYTAWKEGFFYYDHTRLEDILKELGRWYDFEVSYNQEELKEVCFKFWAGRYESLERILRHLNETGRMSLQVHGKQVVVDVVK